MTKRIARSRGPLVRHRRRLRLLLRRPRRAHHGRHPAHFLFSRWRCVGWRMAFFICFVANLLYVWRRKQNYDWLGVSAAEVGLAFTTVVLITGPIWAHPVWGIWWTWDARLTSTFVLWLLYVSYLLLRTLVEEPDRRALLSALFGIFAFLDVPLVFGAIRWWRTQHPSPVVMGGADSGLEPTMRSVLFFSVFAMHVLRLFLILERYNVEKMRTKSQFFVAKWRQHEKSRQHLRRLYHRLGCVLRLLSNYREAHLHPARRYRPP